MTKLDRSLDLTSRSELRHNFEVRHSPLTHRANPSFYQQRGKRIFDLVLVVSALPVLVPVMLLISLLVMLDGGRPIFGHRRIGQGGTEFRCWKLRTMVVDSKERLRAHLAQNPQAQREWDENFKLEHDPRITKLGRFLRCSSLDELPQLWNILCGEMSLVGPRPVVAEELCRYGHALPVYLAQKPGLTGKWQVNGRNAVSYPERVQMDVSYFTECSLKTDITLIAATVAVVLCRTGK